MHFYFITVPSTLSENMDIIDLTVLQVDLMHLLVIQMHNFTSGKYVHQFYDHSHDLQQPKLVLEIAQDEQMIMEPIHLNRQQCFIFYRSGHKNVYWLFLSFFPFSMRTFGISRKISSDFFNKKKNGSFFSDFQKVQCNTLRCALYRCYR